MYNNVNIDEEVYVQLMACIKEQNRMHKQLVHGKMYRVGKAINIIASTFKTKGYYKKTIKYFKNWIDVKRVSRRFPSVANLRESNIHERPNYFTKDRIAVYSCVFGNYDIPEEPVWTPDNCDYYIVTDQFVSEFSKWKKVDLTPYLNVISTLSPAEKNRYFKMHPHYLFNEYPYSIYLDGNIQPVTDLTEYVNMMSPCGVIAHKHCYRDCIYEEAKVVSFLKRDKPERINKHIEFIKGDGLPAHYGLIECNVLVRAHTNPKCQEIMKLWWNEFMEYSKRDQISFIHVLFKMGIKVDEVGIMGGNVYENDSFRKKGHE